MHRDTRENVSKCYDRSTCRTAEPIPGFDYLTWYEFDPQVAHPHDDELMTVAVDDIDIEIPKDLRQQLPCYINPLLESIISFGLDSLHRSVKKTDI